MHNSELLIPLLAIWLTLVVASLIVFTLTKLKPKNSHTELVLRTKSWWLLIAVFSVAMLTGEIVSICFLAFISFLALKEYFSMIPTRRTDRRILFWAYLAIPVQYYFVSIKWYGMFIIFIPVYMFLFFPFRMLLNQTTEGFLKAVGTIHWGVMLTVFAISHSAYLITLPPLLNQNNIGGAGLLLFLVLLTQINDVAQYVWGKSFGKRKIIPQISPKKTWEGFIGGIITTTLIAFFISPFLTPFSAIHSIIVGILISVAGFIGDVTMSALKRDIGIKDTGSTIPGHGGVLDRIDSLTFSAPLFLHYSLYFLY